MDLAIGRLVVSWDNSVLLQMAFLLYSLEDDPRVAFQEGTGACCKGLGPGSDICTVLFLPHSFVQNK